MKIASQAGEAVKIAKEALEIAKGQQFKVDGSELQLGSFTEQAAASSATVLPHLPTQTWVVFDNPRELQKHSAQVAQLNKDIDQFCKSLGIKELKITYRK